MNAHVDIQKQPGEHPPGRVLPRIAARPDPDQWGNDELLTLQEAAALFWPLGPLSVSSLRTAIKDGQLAYTEIAGKFLTTKSSIARMSKCSEKPIDARESPPTDAAIDAGRAAGAALRRIVEMKRGAR